jgi:hypothetical protein
MNKYLFFLGAALTFWGINSCNDPGNNQVSTKTDTIPTTEKTILEKVTSTPEENKDINAFLPKGYVIFEKVYGDLNKDGLDDCVLIIKGTDKNKVITDEYRGELDRNRRGIIILFKTNDGYELATKNYDCFSSENEDGGVYYAPELSFEINKCNLYVNYAHGRYGYWKYTFRFQHLDLELIGYDESSSNGPVINSETSINYLTKKKIVKENTNENAESGEEVFKETVTRMNKSELTKLSGIKDFDEIHASGD